ncbi:hypothetical protein TNCV_3037851 [Trichonephila clavipes]|nr:hypothetical protein TNCV_3037851 [Trichonephila clavipes]
MASAKSCPKGELFYRIGYYRCREQQVFVLGTQALSILSKRVQIQYDDMECKQVMCILRGALRQRYVHHDAASRTGAHLKRRRRATYTPSFSVGAPPFPRVFMLKCQGK